ncbi:MAG: SpoIIE family protein phosphatase [Eubacterium sp.]|nr:SpoIIE family protein phosphatase [Eubacterium sp.]
MRQKFLKQVFLLMIAGGLCMIPMKGYYPFVIGGFSALCTRRVLPMLALPMMIYLLYIEGGILVTMKYGIFMLSLYPFLSAYRNKIRKYNYFVASMIAFPFIIGMEGMDWLLQGGEKAELILIIPMIFLEWSVTAILCSLTERFMQYLPLSFREAKEWKRQQMERGQEMLRRSEAFKKMAVKIRGLSYVENHQTQAMDNYMEKAIQNHLCFGCENGQVQYMERMKLNYLWYNKMLETREAMAIQLNEMAGIMEYFMRQPETVKRSFWGMEELIRKQLKEQRIVAKKIELHLNRKERIEIRMQAKRSKQTVVKTETITKTLERILKRPIRCSVDTALEVLDCFQNYVFFEDVNFLTVSGCVRRTRSDEDVSGDNYTYVEMDCGQTFMSICDGMGSGERAQNYSELVIDLLEQLLNSGFGEDTTLKLINSVMLSGNQWQEPAALDMALIDRYSGICQFLKMGAACTYIKRGNWVECIKSTSLPLGVMENVDMETITKKLYDGDFVIMISDGIVEALQCEDKEEAMGRMIMEIDTLNPREMAFRILSRALEKTDGIPKDDMTVLCTGIWDRLD